MRLVATRSYVVFSRQAFEETMALLRRHTRLSRELRGQLEEEHQMLIVALTELAVERGAGDREYFIRKWLREMRGEPDAVRLQRERRNEVTYARRARANGSS